MSTIRPRLTQDAQWGRSVAIIAAVPCAVAAPVVAGVAWMMVGQAASGISTTTLQIDDIDKHVQQYSQKNGTPSALQGLNAVYGDQKIPKDGWGRDFIFVSPGPNGMAYDIISYGSDGAEGGTGNAADFLLSELK